MACVTRASDISDVLLLSITGDPVIFISIKHSLYVAEAQVPAGTREDELDRA